MDSCTYHSDGLIYLLVYRSLGIPAVILAIVLVLDQGLALLGGRLAQVSLGTHSGFASLALLPAALFRDRGGRGLGRLRRAPFSVRLDDISPDLLVEMLPFASVSIHYDLFNCVKECELHRRGLMNATENEK